MHENLKKRLVGAIVLVALAVTVVPMLLDGAGRKLDEAASFEIPARPEFPQRPLQRLETLDPVTTPAQAAASQAGDAAGDGAEPDALALTPRAWVIQLGAFSSRDNAVTLRDKLRGDGHPAFVETVAEGARYRVRLGPESDRAAAERLRDRLAERGQNAIVVPYP